MPNSKIASHLVRWFKLYARPLPWRVDVDPYHVWISEIMLQQTRVETVKAYYERWMERFPEIHAVASANLQEVLKLWEGLGYYTRARNIKRTAEIICNHHSGKFPVDMKDLMQLPGIGRSTAGAIASIAYKQDAPILDGNVKRVIARIFNYHELVNVPKNEKELWCLTEQLLPYRQAGIFNQAVMELGETICLPKNPICTGCPIRTDCKANEVGIQGHLPVRSLKANVPLYVVVAAVLVERGKILLTQRPLEKLLGGLWEFPGGKVEEEETLQQALRREIMEELQIEVEIMDEIGVYRHAYTHFKVIVHAFLCSKGKGRINATEAPQMAWVQHDQFDGFPMGKVDRMIARDVMARSH